MKKLIFLSGLILATTASATVLHNYNDIASAITSGMSLRMVTNFSKCNTNQKIAATASMSVASFAPNEIGVTDKHIATALTHFTLNDPLFPGKPVKEFVHYTITPDNNMNVTLHVLDATTYSILGGPISFNCKIDVAAKFYA